MAVSLATANSGKDFGFLVDLELENYECQFMSIKVRVVSESFHKLHKMKSIHLEHT